MFYAKFKYQNWPEKTNIRFYFERKRKNEMFRSQKNEMLTSLHESWHFKAFCTGIVLFKENERKS
jgi:hypothetical protein